MLGCFGFSTTCAACQFRRPTLGRASKMRRQTLGSYSRPFFDTDAKESALSGNACLLEKTTRSLIEDDMFTET
jgi:hypothetical protein